MKHKIIIAVLALLMLTGIAVGKISAQGADVPHADTDTFAILISQPYKPVLVMFDAEWCPYCKGMQPALKKLAAKKSAMLTVIRVDTDVETDLTLQYQVRTLPTLVIFRNGEEIARHDGAPKEKVLFDWVESIIGK